MLQTLREERIDWRVREPLLFPIFSLLLTVRSVSELQTAPPLRPDPPQDAVEQALVQISRFLVSSAGADLDQVLALLGDALEADSVYFVLAVGSTHVRGVSTDSHATAPSYLAGRVLSWSRTDTPEEETLPLPSPPDDGSHRVCLVDGEDGRRALAVPLLTEDERFIGYLGIERAGLADPLHAPLDRVLSVLGDVLGNHLSRLAAEEAREQTERRWRTLVDGHPDPTLVVVDGAITYANAAAAHLLGADDSAALGGRPFDDFLSASDIERVDRGETAQLQSAVPYPFEHAVVRLDGDDRIVESVCVPFPGVVNGVQRVLRDITERKDSEERYRTFVETISEGVWRIELDAPVARTASARVQAEHVLQQGRVAELNPTMSRMFWDQTPPIGARLGDLLGAYGPSLIRAFVEAGHHLVGHEIAVRLEDQSTRHFSINAVGRMDRDELVGIWGSCTEITDRVEMERSMVAVLEEQQERIGRDLHDSVGQLLTGVRMLSEGLIHAHEGNGAETTVSRIAAYAAEALDRVRAICRGLVPPQLYSEGAVGALDELVDHVDALGPTRCLFRHDGRTDLYDPDVSLQVYRIAQEALSNALRHAHAETVWVYFGRDEDDILVEVEDDGVGFELDAERAHSIGLYSMHRRAHSIGATLVVETSPGAGTTVRMTIPPGAIPATARPGPPAADL